MENAANLFSPQNIAIIKQIFDFITKNGLVNSLQQLGAIMRAVGFMPSQHQEQKLFDDNKRSDGTLNFDSVLNALGQQSQKEGPPQVEKSQLGQMQQLMDRNGDGKVDMQDLMSVLGGAGGLASVMGGLGGGGGGGGGLGGLGGLGGGGMNRGQPTAEEGGLPAQHHQQGGGSGAKGGGQDIDYMGIASSLAGRFLNK